jgi:hypothetical protein
MKPLADRALNSIDLRCNGPIYPDFPTDPTPVVGGYLPVTVQQELMRKRAAKPY